MKFKLGETQKKIIYLLLLSSTFSYYGNNLIKAGGDFSDGILVGFVMCPVLIFSLAALYLYGRMLYLNFKVVKKSEEV